MSDSKQSVVYRTGRPMTGYDLLFMLMIVVPWLAGIALTSGFWSTTASIVFPPYAWYLALERLLTIVGFIAGGCA